MVGELPTFATVRRAARMGLRLPQSAEEQAEYVPLAPGSYNSTFIPAQQTIENEAPGLHGITHPAMRAWKDLENAASIIGNFTGLVSDEQLNRDIRRRSLEQLQVRRNMRDEAATQERENAPDLISALDVYRRNPQLMVQDVVSAAVSSSPALVTAPVGGIGGALLARALLGGATSGVFKAGLGAWLGSRVGVGVGGMPIEFGSAVIEEATADQDFINGDISFSDAINRRRGEIGNAALNKASGVAAMDTLASMLLGGPTGLAGKIPGKGRLARVGRGTAAGLGEAGLQAAGGAGGEVLGSVLAGQEVRPGAVAGEIAGELGQSIFDILPGGISHGASAIGQTKAFQNIKAHALGTGKFAEEPAAEGEVAPGDDLTEQDVFVPPDEDETAVDLDAIEPADEGDTELEPGDVFMPPDEDVEDVAEGDDLDGIDELEPAEPQDVGDVDDLGPEDVYVPPEVEDVEVPETVEPIPAEEPAPVTPEVPAEEEAEPPVEPVAATPAAGSTPTEPPQPKSLTKNDRTRLKKRVKAINAALDSQEDLEPDERDALVREREQILDDLGGPFGKPRVKQPDFVPEGETLEGADVTAKPAAPAMPPQPEDVDDDVEYDETPPSPETAELSDINLAEEVETRGQLWRERHAKVQSFRKPGETVEDLERRLGEKHPDMRKRKAVFDTYVDALRAARQRVGHDLTDEEMIAQLRATEPGTTSPPKAPKTPPAASTPVTEAESMEAIKRELGGAARPTEPAAAAPPKAAEPTPAQAPAPAAAGPKPAPKKKSKTSLIDESRDRRAKIIDEEVRRGVTDNLSISQVRESIKQRLEADTDLVYPFNSTPSHGDLVKESTEVMKASKEKPHWYGKAEENAKGIKFGDTVEAKKLNGPERGTVVGVYKQNRAVTVVYETKPGNYRFANIGDVTLLQSATPGVKPIEPEKRLPRTTRSPTGTTSATSRATEFERTEHGQKREKFKPGDKVAWQAGGDAAASKRNTGVILDDDEQTEGTSLLRVQRDFDGVIFHMRPDQLEYQKRSKMKSPVFKAETPEPSGLQAASTGTPRLRKKKRPAYPHLPKEAGTFQRRMWSRGTEISEQALHDLGIDPDDWALMPVHEKINTLRRMLKQRFGFKDVVVTERNGPAVKPVNARDAVTVMMDLYHNLRYLAAITKQPINALGFGGKLTVSLVAPNNKWAGMYDPNTRTLYLTGRANFFGHEWWHALDHNMASRHPMSAQKFKDLLSSLTKKQGLAQTNPVNVALARLYQAMFHQDAAVAHEIDRLEKLIQQNVNKDGTPNYKAKQFQKTLDKLREGNTGLKMAETRYRQARQKYAVGKDMGDTLTPKEKARANKSYWAKIEEMLASAFEAYIANRGAAIGADDMRLIAMRDQDFLDNADRRMEMTYPKDHERMAINAAFDDLFAALADETKLPPAGPPELNSMSDPKQWPHQSNSSDAGFVAAVAEEAKTAGEVIQRALSELASDPAGVGRRTARRMFDRAKTEVKDKGTFNALARHMFEWQFWVRSTRGWLSNYINALGKVPEVGPLLREAAEMAFGYVSWKSGEGRTTQNFTFEEIRSMFVVNETQHLPAVLRRLGFKDGRGKNFTAESKARVREAMIAERKAQGPGITDEEWRLAAEFRRILDHVFDRLRLEGGYDFGYVRNTGYFKRAFNADAVRAGRTDFENKATALYTLQFKRLAALRNPEQLLRMANDVPGRHSAVKKAVKKAQEEEDDDALDDALDELIDEIRDEWIAQRVIDFTDALIVSGQPNEWMASPHQGEANFMKERRLPPEADTILKDYLMTDPLQMVLSYVHTGANLIAAGKTYGNLHGNTSLKKVIGKERRAAAEQAARYPKKYNLNTARGQLNIIRDLTTKDDNKHRMLMDFQLRLASTQKANVKEQVDAQEVAFSRMTGKGVTKGGPAARVTALIHAYGTIAMLARAPFTAFTEPLNAYFKLGDQAGMAKVLHVYSGLPGSDLKRWQEFASIVGAISTPIYNPVLYATMGINETTSGPTLLDSFFNMIGLTGITNRQNAAALAGWVVTMKGLIDKLDTFEDKTTLDYQRFRKRLDAEWRELGIGDEDFESVETLLRDSDTMPDEKTMQTETGKILALAARRASMQMIQQPQRADRPLMADSPWGILAYQFQGFLYAFANNVYAANFRRARRNAQIEEEIGGDPKKAWLTHVGNRLLGGVALVLVGQALTTLIREFMFNPDFKEHQEKDLFWWLTMLTLSRSGIFAAADPWFNAATGVRYERDMVAQAVGPAPALIYATFDQSVKLWQRNSENTVRTEESTAKAWAKGFLQPAAAMWLSHASPIGPLSQWGLAGVQWLITSPRMTQAIADYGGTQFMTGVDAVLGPARRLSHELAGEE